MIEGDLVKSLFLLKSAIDMELRRRERRRRLREAKECPYLLETGECRITGNTCVFIAEGRIMRPGYWLECDILKEHEELYD